jgi:AcrR family transcriptional regulator
MFLMTAHVPLMRRRSQGDRTAETRRLLVEAATALLAEEGYGSATTAAIAEKAKVTTGALHHHFGTKEDLFFAVLDAMNERIIAHVQQIHVAAKGVSIARHSIRQLWKAYGDRRYWAVWEIILGQRHDPALRERLAAHRISSIDKVFESWMTGLAIPPAMKADLKDSFAFVLHAIRGLLLERMLKPDARPLRRQLDILVAVLESRMQDVLTETASNVATREVTSKKRKDGHDD